MMAAIGTSRHFAAPQKSVAIGVTDGVIGRPAFRSLEIVGAALQADGETRSAFAASSIRRRSVSHGPFCRTRRISQVLLTLSVMDRDILTGKCRSVTLRRRAQRECALCRRIPGD